jgi:hypothetical protein
MFLYDAIEYMIALFENGGKTVAIQYYYRAERLDKYPGFVCRRLHYSWVSFYDTFNLDSCTSSDLLTRVLIKDEDDVALSDTCSRSSRRRGYNVLVYQQIKRNAYYVHIRLTSYLTSGRAFGISSLSSSFGMRVSMSSFSFVMLFLSWLSCSSEL